MSATSGLLKMTSSKQRGFVIPLALIIISILVMLAMGLSHQARTQIKALQRHQTQWQNELIYRSILQKVLYTLLTGQQVYNYMQSEPQKLPIDGRTITIDGVEVQIQDIAGLMGLGDYHEPQFYQLLLQLTTPEAAQRISQELTDWIDRDSLPLRHGMEATNYLQQGLSYQPRNKMIRGLDELLELPSMTFVLYNGTEKLLGLRNLTTSGISVTLNAATAPQAVLRAALNPSDEQWQSIWAARSAENWPLLQKLLLDFPSAFGDLGPFVSSDAFRIRLNLPNQKAMRVIVKLAPTHSPPYTIQQWYYPDDDRGQS